MLGVLTGLSFYAAALLIGVGAQLLFSLAIRKLRFLPISATACGLIFCAALFLPQGLSRDAYMENVYFAFLIATLLLTSALGCFVGWIVAKARNR